MRAAPIRDSSASDSSAAAVSMSCCACGIRQLLAAAHHGALDSRVEHRTVVVDVDRPQQRPVGRPGEQAGGAFVEYDGMQRRALVRSEHRRAACTCGAIERAARSDERRDVGDGVPDAVAATGALRGVGLVEVATALRVDRDERDVAPVGDVTRAVDSAGTTGPRRAAASASAWVASSKPAGICNSARMAANEASNCVVVDRQCDARRRHGSAGFCRTRPR